MIFRIAQIERIDDHADIGAVLAAHLALRDVDQLDSLAVEFAYGILII